MSPTELDGRRRGNVDPQSQTLRAARRADVWVDERGSEAASKLRAILANAPVVVFAIGRDGVFTLCDGRSLPALGLAPDDVVGRPASVLDAITVTETDGASMPGGEAVRKALGGAEFVGQSILGESVFDFRLFPQRDDEGGEVVGVVGVATDFTQHARAEASLREARERLMVADRLAAIGTLAAGAAHEINNPLTYALINLGHVLRQLRALTVSAPAGDDAIARLVEPLVRSEEGMLRVRGIVRNLLTFSQGTVDHRAMIDVCGVLESSIQMSLHEIVHRARIVRDIGELPPVDANEAALGQVFLNLLVNAAQAIPEGDGREHEIRVRTWTDDDGNAIVEIADTGVGIPRHILPRIFEPFFTSKAVGVGTGLGLSISYGTVIGLGGSLTVTSEVGRGTSFRVLLPPAERWRSRTSGSLRSARSAPAARRRVLVIDDDVLVAEGIARVLEQDAEVVILTDSRAAVGRIAGGERWDVILCDLMMPELSGMDLYAEVVRHAPQSAGRMVFMTAGAFTPRARAFAATVAARCLDKPIDAERLRELVNRRA